MENQAVKAARAVVSVCRTELSASAPWNVLNRVLTLWRTDNFDARGIFQPKAALMFWAMFVCPTLNHANREATARAGAYDFPEIKKDKRGRGLLRKDGDFARVTDGFSKVDALAYGQCRAAAWADACGVAGDLIREGLSAPKKHETKKSKRRGRKSDVVKQRAETQLSADWERARANGIYKGDFAKDKKMSKTDLDALLDRVRKRKSRADN